MQPGTSTHRGLLRVTTPKMNVGKEASQPASRASVCQSAAGPLEARCTLASGTLGEGCTPQTQSRVTCWNSRVSLSKGVGVETISWAPTGPCLGRTEKAAPLSEPRGEHWLALHSKCVFLESEP